MNANPETPKPKPFPSQSSAAPPPEAPKPLWQRLGWKGYTALAIVIVLIIFVAQNSQRTTVSFLFADVEAPLIFALLLATVFGVAIGLLVPRLRRGGEDGD